MQFSFASRLLLLQAPCPRWVLVISNCEKTLQVVTNQPLRRGATRRSTAKRRFTARENHFEEWYTSTNYGNRGAHIRSIWRMQLICYWIGRRNEWLEAKPWRRTSMLESLAR